MKVLKSFSLSAENRKTNALDITHQLRKLQYTSDWYRRALLDGWLSLGDPDYLKIPISGWTIEHWYCTIEMV